MHRTQLLLQERQYRALTARARRERKSLSELVREAVDGFMGEGKKPRRRGRLQDLRGLIHDSGASGAGHDAILYGP